MERYKFKRKPRKCPKCGSSRIAPIMYGYPVSDPDLWRDVDAGNIVLGGCCVTDDDPAWCCVACETQMYKEKATHRNP